MIDREVLEIVLLRWRYLDIISREGPTIKHQPRKERVFIAIGLLFITFGILLNYWVQATIIQTVGKTKEFLGLLALTHLGMHSARG